MEEVNQEQIINECFSTNLDPQNLPDLNTTCTVTDIQELPPNETEKKKTKKKKKVVEEDDCGPSGQQNQENKSKTAKKKKVKENKEKDAQPADKSQGVENTTNEMPEKKKKKPKEKEDKKEKDEKKEKDDKKEKEPIKEDKSKIKKGTKDDSNSDERRTQNRPYSILNIFDNLHGSVKKKQLERILDNLTECGDMICKEYNSKIYLASQKHYPEVDKEELKKIDDETDATRETIAKLKEKNQSLQYDLRQVNTTLTDEELDRQIQSYKSECEKLQLNLKMWQEGTIERIPDEKIELAEKEYEKQKILFKKLKKICYGVVDTLCEGMEMKRDEVIKHIQGFESETDAFALLKNKNI